MTYQSFEDLEVWQRSCRLAVKIYETLRDCKEYGLKDQMTRAALSIASNIAEGSEQNSVADFCRFLHIAKGSAAELRTQVYIASRLGILDKSTAKEVAMECKEISAMLQGLALSFEK